MLVEVKNNIGSRQVFLWIRLSKYVSSSSHFQHANTLEPDSLLVTFDPESYEPYRTPLLDEPNERVGSRSAADPSSVRGEACEPSSVSGVKFERMEFVRAADRAADEPSSSPTPALLVLAPEVSDGDESDDPSDPPSQTMHICMPRNSDFFDLFDDSLVLSSFLLSLFDLEPDILLVTADETDVPDDVVVPPPTEMDCLIDPDPEPVPLQWLLDEVSRAPPSPRPLEPLEGRRARPLSWPLRALAGSSRRDMSRSAEPEPASL